MVNWVSFFCVFAKICLFQHFIWQSFGGFSLAFFFVVLVILFSKIFLNWLVRVWQIQRDNYGRAVVIMWSVWLRLTVPFSIFIIKICFFCWDFSRKSKATDWTGQTWHVTWCGAGASTILNLNSRALSNCDKFIDVLCHLAIKRQTEVKITKIVHKCDEESQKKRHWVFFDENKAERMGLIAWAFFSCQIDNSENQHWTDENWHTHNDTMTKQKKEKKRKLTTRTHLSKQWLWVVVFQSGYLSFACTGLLCLSTYNNDFAGGELFLWREKKCVNLWIMLLFIQKRTLWLKWKLWLHFASHSLHSHFLWFEFEGKCLFLNLNFGWFFFDKKRKKSKQVPTSENK